MLEPLTYQEMLRTLGTLLDECKCENAVIRLSQQGAEIVATGWNREREMTADALRRHSSIQRGWRAQRFTAMPRPETLRWRLRAVGAELDVVGCGSCVITVDPDQVRVQSGDQYDRTFSSESLKRRAMLALHLRGQLGADRSGIFPQSTQSQDVA
jgi:hypothetical protein